MLKTILTAGTAVALALAVVQPAKADMIDIGLQEAGFNGGNITTLTSDTGVGALSLGPTAYGTFTVNQVGAQDQVALGPPGLLNSQSLNVSGTSAGTLNVFVTATGLTGISGLASFLSSFALNSENGNITSVTEATFLDPNNVAYSKAVPLDSDVFTAGLSTQESALSSAVNGAPFSVTEEFSIAATGVGNVNATIDLSATQAVNEPGSLALLGTGLLGLGLAVFWRRRRGGAAYA